LDYERRTAALLDKKIVAPKGNCSLCRDSLGGVKQGSSERSQGAFNVVNDFLNGVGDLALRPAVAEAAFTIPLLQSRCGLVARSL
jgi:hypothetical protein